MKKLTGLAMLLCCLAFALPAGARTAPKTVYAVNSAAYTYHAVPAADFAGIEKALNLPAAKTETDKKAKNLGGFCVFDQQGGKALYIVTETQVLKDEKPLNATAAQRKALLALSRGYWGRPGIPELLGYMSPEKITQVSFDCIGIGMTAGNNGGELLPMDALLRLRAVDAPEAVAKYADIMKSLQVRAGKAARLGPVNTPADLMTAEIGFDTGVSYHMYLWDGAMTIWLDGEAGGVRYEFADTGMPRERGWYLRAEMQDLYSRFDRLEEAVIVRYDAGGDTAARVRYGSALCGLQAFADRFRQEPPVGIKSPFAGGAGSYYEAEDGWIAIYLKPRLRQEGLPQWERIVLWGDGRGGRWTNANGTGYWDPLLPGDSDYIISLMNTGGSLYGDEAARFCGRNLDAVNPF